jgi:hypothetical protein
MANNIFRSVNAVITSTNEVIYTAPDGVTTIVINAHAANTSNSPVKFTFSYFKGDSGDERGLVKDFIIQGNDAYGITLGNFVVNSGDSIKSSANVDSAVRLTLSLLETDA